MADFRGGRGKRVPYKTVMYRIPAPIKPVVEVFGFAYRLLVDGVADPDGENLIKRVENAIAATGYEPKSDPVEKPQISDEDDDSDNEDSDSDIDDDIDETDEQLIRSQSREIKTLKEQLKDSRIDAKLLECKLADVQKERSQLDQELNKLHALNGDLNLEIITLKEKLSEVDQLRSQLEEVRAAERSAVELVIECNSASLRAANILRPTLKFAANAGGKIKTEIKKALELIDDL